MTTFTEAEIAYLVTQPLGRLATLGPDGAPQTRPVGFATTPTSTRSTSAVATSPPVASSATYLPTPACPSSSTTSPAPTPGGRVESRCAAPPKRSPQTADSSVSAPTESSDGDWTRTRSNRPTRATSELAPEGCAAGRHRLCIVAPSASGTYGGGDCGRCGPGR
jgi:hypothetical protein